MISNKTHTILLSVVYIGQKEEKNIKTNNQQIINDFIVKPICSGINLNKDCFSRNKQILYCKSNDIVNQLDIELKRDKKNLVDYNYLKRKYSLCQDNPGYFLKSDDFMLHPVPEFINLIDHRLWGTSFINILESYSDTQDFVGVNIDNNSVRINIHHRLIMPTGKWYGAKFDKKIISIPDGTIRMVPEDYGSKSIDNYCFDNSYSLYIKWETVNNIKTFQAEEFKNDSIIIDYQGVKYHPVRYVHAKFDLNKEYFNHLDGAIHLYNDEEYFLRRDLDTDQHKKSTKQVKADSHKLFKINGKLLANDWLELVSSFLSGNNLVHEYFTGEYSNEAKFMIDNYLKLSGKIL